MHSWLCKFIFETNNKFDDKNLQTKFATSFDQLRFTTGTNFS
jgi:hypothetical protein